MIRWMLFVLVVSTLLSLTAGAAETILRLMHRQARGVWIAALLGSLVLPLWLSSRLPVASGPPVAAALGRTSLVAGATPTTAPARTGTGLDRWLLGLWLAATLATAGTLAAAGWRLRRQRRGWDPAVVQGARVLVSTTTGPAVVGLLRPEIVLPRWTLELAEAPLRLIVRHEREHVEAGDPRLLLAGFAAVVLMPWNPLLWWQLSRLRLAVELDCDGRTLRRGDELPHYARLLLEVGRVRTTAVPVLTGFSEPRSFLERRIRAMTAPLPRHRIARIGGLAALAVVSAAAAWRVPRSAPPALPHLAAKAARPNTERAVPVRHGVLPTDTIYDPAQVEKQPELDNAREVTSQVAANYPPLLRNAGITGRATVQLVIEPDGSVSQPVAVESSHPAFAEAAVRSASSMHFRPGELRGVPVEVRVNIPFDFQLDPAQRQPPPAADVAPAPSPDAGAQPVARAPTDVRSLVEVDRQPELQDPVDAVRIIAAAYPPMLREAGISGQATVEMVVGTDGFVTQARAVSSTREEFARAAVGAASRLHFRPARRNGRTVAVRLMLPVSFTPEAAAGSN